MDPTTDPWMNPNGEHFGHSSSMANDPAMRKAAEKAEKKEKLEKLERRRAAFSTSGHLSEINMGRLGFPRWSHATRDVIYSMEADTLKHLAAIRASHDKTDFLISCVYRWPAETLHYTMITFTFDDGLEWLLQVPKRKFPSMQRPANFGHTQFGEMKFLRKNLGSIIPEVIEWSKTGNEFFDFPFILTTKARGHRLSELLESQLQQEESKIPGFAQTTGNRQKLLRCFRDLAKITIQMSKYSHDTRATLELQGPDFEPVIRPRDYQHMRDIPESIDHREMKRTFALFAEIDNIGDRPKRSELDTIFQLVKKAGTHSSASKTHYLRLNFDEIYVDEEDGHITTIIPKSEVMMYLPPMMSIHCYPEELRDEFDCDYPDSEWADEGCMVSETKLGDSHCDVMDYLRAAWRLCITHYSTAGLDKPLKVDDIIRSLPHETYCDSLVDPCRWDVPTLLHVLYYQSQETWKMIVQGFLSHERNFQRTNPQLQAMLNEDTKGGQSPKETCPSDIDLTLTPDISHVAFLEMHLDDLVFYKIDETLRVKFEDEGSPENLASTEDSSSVAAP